MTATLAASSQLGPYQILGLLGAGGMGEVYRARDRRLRRDVAIKVLPTAYAGDQELLKRFEREARAISQLNHPNIIAIYDIGSADGVEYVVMELLEGETLGTKLQSGPLSARKTLDYAAQIARGLAAAHEKNIIHRDLKPENIFIARDGRVKILDFGLAHQHRGGGDLGHVSSKLTAPGMVVGTVSYMSPEQTRGLDVDRRSDIFSFGVVLYEMLSGQLPFEQNTVFETMTAILNREPADLKDLVPNLPPVLYRIVTHCLEKSPDARFQTANDLLFDLETCSEIPWAGTGPLVLPAPEKKRPIAAIAAAVAALLIAAAGLTAYLKMRTPATAEPSFHRLTFKPTLIQSARFTADGDTVVYSASRRMQPTRLHMLRTDHPESHAMTLPSAELASISGAGEMAVILNPPTWGRLWDWYGGGTLAEVPVLGGTPREIANGVIMADWSPDGRLAVWRKTDKGYQLEFPLGHVLYTSNRLGFALRISPKGDQIAMNVQINDQRSDIIVVGLDGSTRTLASAAMLARGMAWAPDGKEVWFATQPEAQQVPTIYAVTLGGKQRQVMRSPGWPWLHDIARDGTLLLAITSSLGGIMVPSEDGTKETDFSWLDASILADVSADGKSILFTESWEGVEYKVTVYMRRLDDSPAVRLGDGMALGFSPQQDMVLALRPGTKRRELILMPTGPGKTEPVPNDLDCLWAGWLPDGRLIINARTAAGMRMFVQARDGTPPRPVTPPGVGIGSVNPAGGGAIKPVSPDGRSLLVFDHQQQAWLFDLGAATGKPAMRRAQGVMAGDRPAGWSRDGRHLFVYPAAQMPLKVYDVDLTTGERRLLRELTGPDPEAMLRMGPVLLMPDGKSFAYGYYQNPSTLYTATGLR